MKKFKILLFILCSLIIIQGCNKKNKLTEQETNYIISNISVTNLDKTEIDISKNEIFLYIKEEFIFDEDINYILNSITFENEKGIYSLNSEKLSSKNLIVKIISIENKNEIIINTTTLPNFQKNIVTNKYSENYIKNKTKNIANNILKFNELVGRLEIDFKQDIDSKTRFEEFNEVYLEIVNNIKYLDNIPYENIDYANFSNEKNKFSEIIKIVEIVKIEIDKAYTMKNSSLINNQYLNINLLDKYARELTTV